ncbi:hypothetical protein L915_02206 [Phytophthora nicotianae]|uniref:Uncharacterized protein n=1 Tax=Phytophthora nicotianae TaxID=4792 RepID=W2HI35_PHYNI|nr:hypothetical protein L915_02206 [Phytophthora nicotianae]
MRVCKRGATEHDDEGLVVTACGKARAEKLTDVYYAAELDEKGYTLSCKDDKRVVAAKTDESVAFDHELLRNMLVWRGSVDTWSVMTSEVIVVAMVEKSTRPRKWRVRCRRARSWSSTSALGTSLSAR